LCFEVKQVDCWLCFTGHEVFFQSLSRC
jgi:hypothetical protein